VPYYSSFANTGFELRLNITAMAAMTATTAALPTVNQNNSLETAKTPEKKKTTQRCDYNSLWVCKYMRLFLYILYLT